MNGSHGCIFLVIFFFIITASTAGRENPLFDLSTSTDLVQMAGYGEEKLSSVLVTGTVLCEACLGGDEILRAWPVSGALVAVTCNTSRKKRNSNWAKVSTDEYGDFIIDLPSHLHAIPKLEKTCIVRVVRLPKSSPCRRVFIGKPKGIRLSSWGNGIRTYTTGRITFQQPSRHSHLCLRKADSAEGISW